MGIRRPPKAAILRRQIPARFVPSGTERASRVLHTKPNAFQYSEFSAFLQDVRNQCTCQILGCFFAENWLFSYFLQKTCPPPPQAPKTACKTGSILLHKNFFAAPGKSKRAGAGHRQKGAHAPFCTVPKPRQQANRKTCGGTHSTFFGPKPSGSSSPSVISR